MRITRSKRFLYQLKVNPKLSKLFALLKVSKAFDIVLDKFSYSFPNSFNFPNFLYPPTLSLLSSLTRSWEKTQFSHHFTFFFCYHIVINFWTLNGRTILSVSVRRFDWTIKQKRVSSYVVEYEKWMKKAAILWSEKRWKSASLFTRFWALWQHTKIV